MDAIAKELEKSDSADAKRSPKGAKGSPKKGKKPAMEGEKSKEEWVDLIFGANGEKVTNILNTLHNSKRLGPFLGFGYNFWVKQDKCLETDKFGQTSYTSFGFCFWVLGIIFG